MIDNDFEEIARKAAEDEHFMDEFMERLLSKDENVRYSSFLALLRLGSERGQLLYPKWDYIAGFLESENAYRRLMAVRLLAGLASVDVEDRFEKVFDRYFGLLDDSVTVAGHVAGDCWRIVIAKPELEDRVIDRLLDLKNSTHKHRDLINSYAIGAFDMIYEGSKRKGDIMAFVREQLDCESPKTRKMAKEFLKKWENV